ncbi:hypothetical protein NLG97_g3548 [Lecanicillium saksenae]|uniref:Uncharacterized protein n=1 Tax=Lecanicillium saksenae TaxID=468837 RepID=A0ACC1R113_9HYPO|nr:hypothetical protein NLG97_g3548 [Lecanicillium saksenae]
MTIFELMQHELLIVSNIMLTHLMALAFSIIRVDSTRLITKFPPWVTLLRHLALALTFSINGYTPERLKNATQEDLQKAIKLVDDVMEEVNKHNLARLEHVRRNRYTLAPNTKLGRRDADAQDQVPVPSLFKPTAEIVAAAALVAEAEVAMAHANRTNDDQVTLNKRDGFWMETIARKGTSPWGDDPNYKIFRSVKDYGAHGDGHNGDTEAIKRAIADGKRCGAGCNGSSTKNAIVYFPPGTYLVSESIQLYFGTQLIGDANNSPTIKTPSRFVGLRVFSTDYYTGDGLGADGKDNEWYINTANFYRQIRNFKIDISGANASRAIVGLHYQVAQATSLQNIEFTANSNGNQQCIFAENGSGGVMSDLTFNGCQYGIYGGSQQFTANRLTFNSCKTAVQIFWDWGWLWKSIKVNDCDTGFYFVPLPPSNRSVSKENGNVGSAAFMETDFKNVKQAIVIQPPSDKPGTGTTGLVLNRVTFTGVDKAVSDTSGNTILNDTEVGGWVLGPTYEGVKRTWSKGAVVDDAVLTPAISEGTKYLERPKPQYEDKSTADFIHLKDYAKGDGSTDDTVGVQKALLAAASGGKILFADAGVYLLTGTVTIPSGSKIVGETWTQFVATGSFFGDIDKPRPVIRVGGTADAVGDVEMQDLLFTTKGPTPGAIMVQWNMKAKSKAGAALWGKKINLFCSEPNANNGIDCHVRLGGATGTQLTPKECPALTTGEVKSDCIAASMLLHVTPGATGYFDNMWLWVADHIIDDPDWSDDKNDMTQISIYSARGLLLETQEGVLLYGTASEHSVLYQYNFFGVQCVFAGLLQTESPYFQPSPPAPVPFADSLGVFPGDPSYDQCEKSGNQAPGCDSSWGLIVTKSEYVHVGAAGIYSWFHTYAQDCIDKHQCQNALVQLNENYENVRIEQLITIGSTDSFVTPSDVVMSLDNLAIDTHPSWSQISMVNATTGKSPDGDGNDGDPDWQPCGDNPYKTLEDFANAIGKIPEHCIVPFALQILLQELADALKQYAYLLKHGYDKNFGYYTDYIKKVIDYRLDDFVWNETGPGNKYFDCTLRIVGDDEPHVQRCPWTIYQLASYDDYSIEYNLRDQDGFFKDLEDNMGLLESWVKFGREKQENTTCSTHPPDPDCNPSHKQWLNRPGKSDNVTVPNPKDLIDKAMGGYNTLFGTIAGSYMQSIMGEWDGAPEDALQVLSMPVSLAQQAVANMKEVSDIGNDAHKKELERFILDIVAIVLFVLPFVGEVVGELGELAAVIGRIIDIAEGVGNPALAFYDLAKNPTSAPMDILGILLGIKGKSSPARSGEDVAIMAAKKQGFTTEQIANMGAIYQKNQGLVDKLLSSIVTRACKGK